MPKLHVEHAKLCTRSGVKMQEADRRRPNRAPRPLIPLTRVRLPIQRSKTRLHGPANHPQCSVNQHHKSPHHPTLDQSEETANLENLHGTRYSEIHARAKKFHAWLSYCNMVTDMRCEYVYRDPNCDEFERTTQSS